MSERLQPNTSAEIKEVAAQEYAVKSILNQYLEDPGVIERLASNGSIKVIKRSEDRGGTDDAGIGEKVLELEQVELRVGEEVSFRKKEQ